MKITEFKNKDGKISNNYKPEAGDSIVCLADSVYKSEPRAVIAGKGTKKERAVNITTRGIKAKWEEKEIFCLLTEGQTKNLAKEEHLMGKTLVFNEYTSDKWGKLVGVSVKK